MGCLPRVPGKGECLLSVGLCPLSSVATAPQGRAGVRIVTEALASSPQLCFKLGFILNILKV